MQVSNIPAKASKFISSKTYKNLMIDKLLTPEESCLLENGPV
jgi:hypothetical protein